MKVTLRKAIRTALTLVPRSDSLKPMFQRLLLAMRKRPFEPEFQILRGLRDVEDALFLDIGGNQGFAVDAILLYMKRCRVVTFEPSPLLAEDLKTRFARDHRVTVSAFGLGDQDGDFTLYTPIYRSFRFFGLASMIRNEAESWLAHDEILSFNPARLTMHEARCSVRRLDSLGYDPLFMKIDVQGYELAVLKGGCETIRRSKPIILIETATEEHLRFLQPFGYSLYRYEPHTHGLTSGGSGTVNSFFIPHDKLNLFDPELFTPAHG